MACVQNKYTKGEKPINEKLHVRTDPVMHCGRINRRRPEEFSLAFIWRQRLHSLDFTWYGGHSSSFFCLSKRKRQRKGQDNPNGSACLSGHHTSSILLGEQKLGVKRIIWKLSTNLACKLFNASGEHFWTVQRMWNHQCLIRHRRIQHLQCLRIAWKQRKKELFKSITHGHFGQVRPATRSPARPAGGTWSFGSFGSSQKNIVLASKERGLLSLTASVKGLFLLQDFQSIDSFQ